MTTILVLLLLLTGRVGQTAAAQSESNQGSATATSCLFDFESGEVPNCLRQDAKGNLFVASPILKQLHFDSHGLASVLSRKAGWMYVNRNGKVVISGVPSMENGPDSFHDGLVRIVKDEKYGFANRQGQIVVPPIYDGAMNFEKGRAKVCKGCQSKCVAPDCEYHSFEGGEWLQIDTKGAVLAQ